MSDEDDSGPCCTKCGGDTLTCKDCAEEECARLRAKLDELHALTCREIRLQGDHISIALEAMDEQKRLRTALQSIASMRMDISPAGQLAMVMGIAEKALAP